MSKQAVVEALTKLDRRYKANPGMLLISTTPQRRREFQRLRKVYERRGVFSIDDMSFVDAAAKQLTAGYRVIVDIDDGDVELWISAVTA